MKRKALVTMLCLAISVSAMACGTENTTEQQEVIATEQTAETEEVETETQKVETQETETQETADNVEETENYEELVSVPVDGRDGSKENPYQVGDTIYFPKVVVGWDNAYETAIFSPLTVVVEEATSEYVKISYKFGVDSWEDLDWENWYDRWIEMNTLLTPFREDSEFNQVGSQLDTYNSLNNQSDIVIQEANKTETTLYYQDFDGVGCTEDTAYLMLVYSKFSIPMEECTPGFNCTFVEVPKS
ncbi:hypothetical protein [Roseburia hominis]|uniref:hypothetical protein n=1 Tax=Roseburia hominis TaxID=301301 RepID=UPI0026EF6BFA|nr:hypothetical protein [Roseburia hominis]MCI7523064.1 hypothetical protein [Roseburia hominis]